MKKHTVALAAADRNAQSEQYRKPTRRNESLATMARIAPWQALCSVIGPHCPGAGKGRSPLGLDRMLGMYFVQHRLGLADQVSEETLPDRTALSRFAGIDLGRDHAPDARTLFKSRRPLEQPQFAKVGAVPAHGLKIRLRAVFGATIIAVPSSTKKGFGQRNPEVRPTRKGNPGRLCMKPHIGGNSRTDLTHNAIVTSANAHDKHPLGDLPRDLARRLCRQCVSVAAQAKPIEASQAEVRVSHRMPPGGATEHPAWMLNRVKSGVRSKLEHAFTVVKQLQVSTRPSTGSLPTTRAGVRGHGLSDMYLAQWCLVERRRRHRSTVRSRTSHDQSEIQPSRRRPLLGQYCSKYG